MILLNFIKIYSKSRKFWSLLILTVTSIELITLYLQHISLFQPCVLCIYQRCALLGIAISGFIAIIAPTIKSLRILAISIWIYSSWKGLILAKKYATTQFHPSPFSTCDLFIQFPNWIPLDQWWPAIFSAYGDCSEYNILSLNISQWMIIIFFIYLIIALLNFTAQFIK